MTEGAVSSSASRSARRRNAGGKEVSRLRPLPITSFDTRAISTSCASPPPAKLAPSAREIPLSTPTEYERAPSLPLRCYRSAARRWRTRPTPRPPKSPSGPCLSIIAPRSTCPSAFVPRDVGICPDVKAPRAYGRRREPQGPTADQRVRPLQPRRAPSAPPAASARVSNRRRPNPPPPSPRRTSPRQSLAGPFQPGARQAQRGVLHPSSMPRPP